MTFTQGQSVYVAHRLPGGSPVGAKLIVMEVDPGGSIGRGANRVQLADRIKCSDGRWYYPDFLSTEPTT